MTLKSEIRKQFNLKSAYSLVFIANSTNRFGHFFLGISEFLYKQARKVAPAFRSPREQETISYHEAGHALLATVLPGNGRVLEFNVFGNRTADGVVWIENVSMGQLDRKQMINIIAMTLGGLVAEEEKYGQNAFSAGAFNDLKSATLTAKRMVNEFGMSELGIVSLANPHRASFLIFGKKIPYELTYGSDASEKTKEKIEEVVQKIIEEAKEIARSSLEENWHVIEHIVDHAKTKYILTGDELRQIINEAPAPEQK